METIESLLKKAKEQYPWSDGKIIRAGLKLLLLRTERERLFWSEWDIYEGDKK